MIRRLVCACFVGSVIGLVGGCEKPPVSTNPDAPIKVGGGTDKKGKKSKSIEASFEDPPRK